MRCPGPAGAARWRRTRPRAAVRAAARPALPGALRLLRLPAGRGAAGGAGRGGGGRGGAIPAGGGPYGQFMTAELILTVFYTPLIIALASTGATIHKGFLRIVGCSIGGALGLICAIWVIPRFETLETFLFIVFCVHGLAAWIAVGDDRISYIGLQIALAFDLGFLQGYGPPDNIDPIRDRFIGIVLGICIVTTVFAVIWPESADLSARERLAASLRTIARLLRLGRGNNGSQNWSSQREQLELEIASRLSEANSYKEQAAFEELIQGSKATEGPKLEDAIAATEEIYVCSLPWIREQRSGQTIQQAGEPKSTLEFAERLPNAVEACADRIDRHQRQIADRDHTPIDYLIEKKDSGASQSAGRLEELLSAVVELQVLVSAQERQTNEN